MMKDQQTTIAELRNEVRNFVADREWEKFHSPKNISMALAVEAAELMEHFQWIGEEESQNLDVNKLVEVGEEIADIFCYLMAISNSLNIDLASVFNRKMRLNKEKYPIEKFRGRFGSDDPTPVSSK